MSDWNWNGARWWKFDFHAHTPASEDYGKGTDQAALRARTPKEWLMDYMRAGIDCVAITDHNSGDWVDPLMQAYREMKVEKSEGFRPIHLFPGVEISANGNIHVLALFDPSRTTADINILIGAVDYSGTRGYCDGNSRKSISEVLKIVVDRGGIAIPAHADGLKGLFTQTGNTLKDSLECREIFSIELLDSAYHMPRMYFDKKCDWTKIIGSDAHHPSPEYGYSYPGSRYTWVKMGNPDIEGLGLALLDGSPLSIRRSDDFSGSMDPNEQANTGIVSIEVDKARFLGREPAFKLELSPWLNTIIGGRGTGKSTLIEFLRLVLRRKDELKATDQEEDFVKYWSVHKDRDDSGLLTVNTAIRVIYRKEGADYRIQWGTDSSLDPIQEWTGNDWNKAEGDIRQRFPIRIYSQKQIYQMANKLSALLDIVDEAKVIDFFEWNKRRKSDENQYLSLRAKIREIQAGFEDEPRIKGELEDVKRRLGLFETLGHTEILRAYQKRHRQAHIVTEWETAFGNLGSNMRKAADELHLDDLNEMVFDKDNDDEGSFLALVHQTIKSVETVLDQLRNTANQLDTIFSGWQAEKANSAWKSSTDQVMSDYENLLVRLRKEGVSDPSEYGVLLQRRQMLENTLFEFDGRRKQIAELDKQAVDCLQRLMITRREITVRRRLFLNGVLSDNHYVRIVIIPYGAKERAIGEFREIIQRETSDFEKDIGSFDSKKEGLLSALYNDAQNADEFERSLTDLKRLVREIAANPAQPQKVSKWFSTHLSKLPPEAFDRMDLWFPEDSLEVTYRASDRDNFNPIESGSPGQKTAALLSFLLSYGEEPLVLDQPEDDLDNHLIYKLIVTQLRENKRKRQVIVITHNANIVVNGDAEMVAALAAKGGQTVTEACGSLQEREVRKTICDIMEGGEKAFEARYRRIKLEGRHV